MYSYKGAESCGQYEQIRCSLRTYFTTVFFVSDIAIFVLKRDVKLQLTNYHGVSIYDLKIDNRFDSATFLQEADILAIFSFRFLDGFLFPLSKID